MTYADDLVAQKALMQCMELNNKNINTDHLSWHVHKRCSCSENISQGYSGLVHVNRALVSGLGQYLCRAIYMTVFFMVPPFPDCVP